MAINLDAALIHVIVSVITISPMLWLAGRALVGKEKAKFRDALWIVVLGTLIGSFLQFAFSGIAASLIVLFVWLWLTKRFFDCGWLKAFLIALVAVVIFIIIGVILAVLGFLAFRALLQLPWP
jgi:hypothetical protein